MWTIFKASHLDEMPQRKRGKRGGPSLQACQEQRLGRGGDAGKKPRTGQRGRRPTPQRGVPEAREASVSRVRAQLAMADADRRSAQLRTEN